MATNRKMYYEEYREFLQGYKTGLPTNAELVGELIGRLSSDYCDYNLQLVEANRQLFMVAGDIEARTDDNGKTISSAKAQSFVNATDQNFKAMELKAHLSNLEVFMSALRSLQKGILNEYSYQGNN